MVDEYEYAEPQQAPRLPPREMATIESYPDLIQWFNDPESKIFDPKFLKDIVLSNLNEKEISVVRNFMEFTRELKGYPALSKAEKHFIATMFDWVLTSNAKKGFARRLSITTRSEHAFERKEEPKTQLLGFMHRKQRRY